MNYNEHNQFTKRNYNYSIISFEDFNANPCLDAAVRCDTTTRGGGGCGARPTEQKPTALHVCDRKNNHPPAWKQNAGL